MCQSEKTSGIGSGGVRSATAAAASIRPVPFAYPTTRPSASKLATGSLSLVGSTVDHDDVHGAGIGVPRIRVSTFSTLIE